MNDNKKVLKKVRDSSSDENFRDPKLFSGLETFNYLEINNNKLIIIGEVHYGKYNDNLPGNILNETKLKEFLEYAYKENIKIFVEVSTDMNIDEIKIKKQDERYEMVEYGFLPTLNHFLRRLNRETREKYLNNVTIPIDDRNEISNTLFKNTVISSDDWRFNRIHFYPKDKDTNSYLKASCFLTFKDIYCILNHQISMYIFYCLKKLKVPKSIFMDFIFRNFKFFDEVYSVRYPKFNWASMCGNEIMLIGNMIHSLHNLKNLMNELFYNTETGLIESIKKKGVDVDYLKRIKLEEDLKRRNDLRNTESGNLHNIFFKYVENYYLHSSFKTQIDELTFGELIDDQKKFLGDKSNEIMNTLLPIYLIDFSSMKNDRSSFVYDFSNALICPNGLEPHHFDEAYTTAYTCDGQYFGYYKMFEHTLVEHLKNNSGTKCMYIVGDSHAVDALNLIDKTVFDNNKAFGEVEDKKKQELIENFTKNILNKYTEIENKQNTYRKSVLRSAIRDFNKNKYIFESLIRFGGEDFFKHFYNCFSVVPIETGNRGHLHRQIDGSREPVYGPQNPSRSNFGRADSIGSLHEFEFNSTKSSEKSITKKIIVPTFKHRARRNKETFHNDQNYDYSTLQKFRDKFANHTSKLPYDILYEEYFKEGEEWVDKIWNLDMACSLFIEYLEELDIQLKHLRCDFY